MLCSFQLEAASVMVGLGGPLYEAEFLVPSNLEHISEADSRFVLCFGVECSKGLDSLCSIFLLSRSEMLSGGEGQKSPRHPKPYLTIRNWNEADWS